MLRNMSIVMFMSCLITLSGCQLQNVENRNEDVYESSEFSSMVKESPLPTNKDSTVQISIASVEGITESEAIDLCFEMIGKSSEETGFKLAYRCIGAIECKGVEYYVMNVTWLVDDNHWSYIGEVMVSANGDEIYDGVSENGDYYLHKLLALI